MNLSKEINDKHIFGISKLLSFMLLATMTAALKRTPVHQTVLIYFHYDCSDLHIAYLLVLCVGMVACRD